MHTKRFIYIGVAALVGACLLGCSKSPSNRSAKERNFGVVELSPQIPRRMNLGHNKDCVITLAMLPDGNLRWDVFIETKAGDGKVERSSTSSLTQRPDQKDCGVTVGDTTIILTPKVRTEK
jgi:hypothetical protein